MFTVAVLADVHGNLDALDAVLADLAMQRHDTIVLAGNPAREALVTKQEQEEGRACKTKYTSAKRSIRKLNSMTRLDLITPKPFSTM